MATEISGQTHSDKYQIPDALDNGVEFATTIENFMTKMAKHTHNGVTSADISLNIKKTIKEYVPSGGVLTGEQEFITWSILANGIYTSIIPLADTNYDLNVRLFFVEKAGLWIPAQLKTTFINATTFTIYSNQPTLKLRVVSI